MKLTDQLRGILAAISAVSPGKEGHGPVQNAPALHTPAGMEYPMGPKPLEE